MKNKNCALELKKKNITKCILWIEKFTGPFSSASISSNVLVWQRSFADICLFTHKEMVNTSIQSAHNALFLCNIFFS